MIETEYDFCQFCVVTMKNYEVYQEKMSKHKHLSELAESSHAVNVDISNKMKYYDMLNQESKWGCKWEGGGEC